MMRHVVRDFLEQTLATSTGNQEDQKMKGAKTVEKMIAGLAIGVMVLPLVAFAAANTSSL
jgi:hypothetical protein